MGLIEDLEYRGLVHQVTSPDLARLLNAPAVPTGQGRGGGAAGEGLVCYAGFDPTAPSLHLGNLLPILLLRRLQLGSHHVIAVAGGGTGLIGDPSGKSSERPLLDEEPYRENLRRITGQLEALIDFSSGSAEVVDNASWLRSLSLIDFLRDTGKHFTVAQMVAKESVRSRMDRPEQGISFTEFSYMLLQAYDYLNLYDTRGCRLQVGASDQWGNITLGVELIGKLRGVAAYGLTTPLLLRADGVKLGKTESGTVWLDPQLTSPYQLYQYLVRVDDSEVVPYLKMLTFLDHDAIEGLGEAVLERPDRREAQRALAREVCAIVHGEDEAARAERTSEAIYSENVAELAENDLLDACSDAPVTKLARSAVGLGDAPPSGCVGGEGNASVGSPGTGAAGATVRGGSIHAGAPVVDLLVTTGLCESKARARTTLAQGGVYINNRRVVDETRTLTGDDLLFGRYALLRRGKREYHLIKVV